MTETRNRSYQYLLRPSHTQKESIRRNIRCTGFVYRRYLRDRRSGEILPPTMKETVHAYQKSCPFLNEADSSALMHILFQMNHRDLSSIKSARPRRRSYTTGNYQNRIRLVKDRYLHLPTVGDVRIVLHRPLPNRAVIRSVTVSMNHTGQYYASILFDKTVPSAIRKDPRFLKVIGLDYSNSHFYVDSEGRKLDIPHFYRRKEQKLIKLNRQLSRYKRDSIAYRDTRHAIARIHQGIACQRRDFLHKLSYWIADTYDIVCVEDLDMQQISRSYSLGKATLDNAYGIFLRMLKYKLEDRGKSLITVDRWFPSSKLCHCCGHIKHDLRMSERSWRCPSCGAVLDRDVNAALNIRQEGLRIYSNTAG